MSSFKLTKNILKQLIREELSGMQQEGLPEVSDKDQNPNEYQLYLRQSIDNLESILKYEVELLNKIDKALLPEKTKKLMLSIESLKNTINHHLWSLNEPKRYNVSSKFFDAVDKILRNKK